MRRVLQQLQTDSSRSTIYEGRRRLGFREQVNSGALIAEGNSHLEWTPKEMLACCPCPEAHHDHDYGGNRACPHGRLRRHRRRYRQCCYHRHFLPDHHRNWFESKFAIGWGRPIIAESGRSLVQISEGRALAQVNKGGFENSEEISTTRQTEDVSSASYVTVFRAT